ncbi:hypothetical protein QS257_16925 [Terrilactibacillus sp. S3-3]|nr:hypothetical protein QS257_16925 [Terrilactibacillus sp. S3-3]
MLKTRMKKDEVKRRNQIKENCAASQNSSRKSGHFFVVKYIRQAPTPILLTN